jgi:hypothetical protein
MKIIKIESSPIKNKRLRAFLDDGSHLDFGLKNASTYIEHHDKNKRLNYWLRHVNNPYEKDLILNYVMSPSLLSAFILWGRYTNIEDNIEDLNHYLRR